MSFREGVSASRRYSLSLPADLGSQVATFAQQNGLGLGPAIRVLVARGLSEPASVEDSPAALAALVAAEQAILMVASILPEGEQRIHTTAQPATDAAGRRLSMFRESGVRPREVDG